jgi:hypothetical protein
MYTKAPHITTMQTRINVEKIGLKATLVESSLFPFLILSIFFFATANLAMLKPYFPVIFSRRAHMKSAPTIGNHLGKVYAHIGNG